MKVFISGAAGFIGSHLRDALLEDGHDVTGCDTYEHQVHGSAPLDRLLVKGVFKHSAGQTPPHTLAGLDALVHLGAFVGVGQAQYQPASYVYANVADTVQLWQHILSLPPSERPRRVLVASSMSVYGEGDRHKGVHEERAIYPAKLGVYAQTKYNQETYSLSLGREYGVPTTAYRFFNVYGERQSLTNPYTGVAALFAVQLLKGRGALVYEDGCQSRDFIHVSDIVRGLMLAIKTPAGAIAGEVFNLGTGQPTSLLALHENLAFSLKREDLEPCITGKKRSGDIRHCHADVSKARAMLGFMPHVGLRHGLHAYAEWLRTQDTSALESRVEQAWKELEQKGLAA